LPQRAGGRNVARSTAILAVTGTGRRRCEKINNLIRQPTDQGAKIPNDQLLCFLCVLRDFVRRLTDEMLLLVPELFHTVG
jgi:hypothetical protein